MIPVLWAGAAGCLLFVVVFLLDGFTRPGYEPLRHPVSALALGPRGWIQTVDFLVCGLLVAVSSVAVPWAVSSDSWAVWPLSAAIGLFGIGLLLSGVFRMDPMWGYPPGAPEGTPEETGRAHRIHDNLGAVVFFSLPAAALIAAFALQDPLWRWGSGVAGVIVGAGTLAFANAWEKEAPNAGLIQRVTLIVGLGWLGLLLGAGALGAL
ncbi:DUF998 domain-containing protein [Nocardiopsis alba]|uniref:DUF998 domain-containing protein n=1 Tax=Nocardiopsis alba TaxID=53437 RepID=UPI0033D3F0DA